MRAEGLTVLPLPVIEPSSDRIIKKKNEEVQQAVPVGNLDGTEVGPDQGKGRLGNIVQLVEERRKQTLEKRNKAAQNYKKMKNPAEFPLGQIINKSA